MAALTRASDADRAYVYELLREQFARANIDNAELDRRVEQVERAVFTDQVVAAVSDLPEIVPATVGQGLPVRGNRGEVIALLRNHFALGRMDQDDLRRREARVLDADLASGVAAAVYGLPPAPTFGGRPGVAPVDLVRPGLTNPLGTRDALLHSVTLERIFRGTKPTFDRWDMPAWFRAVTAIRTTNAHGLLMRPPPRTGDLLTELTVIDARLYDLVVADAGKLRTSRQLIQSWSTSISVRAREIGPEAARIGTEFRRDNVLRDLSRDDFVAKFSYYMWRLGRLSPFSDRFYDRTSRVERMLLSAYAHDAGWQIDWNLQPRTPRSFTTLMREMGFHSYGWKSPAEWFTHRDQSVLRELQTAVGGMVSRAPAQGGSGLAEWAQGELVRQRFDSSDLRILEAVGYNAAVALRGELGPDHGGSQQQAIAGEPRRAAGSRSDGRRSGRRQRGRPGRPGPFLTR